MNINFKTHFPWAGADGQPEATGFREKILEGLRATGREPRAALPRVGGAELTPKLHTIRRVPANGRPRYREGMKLVLCTGSRFKSVPFAETVCTGVQEVEMSVICDRGALVLAIALVHKGVNMYNLSGPSLKELSVRDGLTVESFTKWFTMDVITRGPGLYQVVHWTDVRY